MPDWSRIHRERRFGFWTLPLALCSAVYSLGVRLRQYGYAVGMFKGNGLPGFVVSIGNLTAGGTGKTPAVVMLAKWAMEQGLRVAVLSRGYGRKNGQDVVEVSDGQGKYADVRMAGDEPSLIARSVPECPVIVSRSRRRAGLYASQRFGSDFFILDDGFQHLQLERDLNLVLMDAVDPFGNGHLLPWGPLREPVAWLRRADAVIFTRFPRDHGAQSRTPVSEHGAGGVAVNMPWVEEDIDLDTPRMESLRNALSFLNEKFPAMPVFFAHHEPERVIFPRSRAVRDPDFLKNKRLVGFAGIAHPEYFNRTLSELGSTVLEFKWFGDHYPFEKKDVEELIRVKESMGADYLVTTEKDWMRIDSLASPYPDLAYLCIRFRLLAGEDGFFRMVRDGLRK